jgi:hypothetical protein
VVTVMQGRCPVCGSEEVYVMVDTLHCKRCANIWTEENNAKCTFDACNVELPASNRTWTPAIQESPEIKMEKQLEQYLKKYKGKFTTSAISSNIGDIQMAMFRGYLKKCVKKRTLVEKKDDYGRFWYSRPD